MPRLILVPQYPARLRYQEWWFTEFPDQLSKHFEVLVLGENFVRNPEDYRQGMFSPIKASISMECQQIEEYMQLELKSDDILFLHDLSFPGLFASVLFHKQCSKMFAFCHATSLNHLDYFEPWREIKFPIETAYSQLFDKVFVGSEYHQKKLGWKNTKVVSLPYPPLFPSKLNKIEKVHDIISVARPTPQKVDKELEDFVESIFGPIYRPRVDTWYGYFSELLKSKILLVTANEDTFGYQLIDAVLSNCVPLARRDFAYPEILPDEYLYSDKDELVEKIEKFLSNPVVPEILCHDKMSSFFETITKEML